jgi:hypothetical protein
MTGASIFVMLIESCVGSAMVIYGWRQKEPVALAFGVGLTLLPYFVHNAWVSGLLGVILVALFFTVRKSFD